MAIEGVVVVRVVVVVVVVAVVVVHWLRSLVERCVSANG